MYFDVLTSAEFDSRVAAIGAERDRVRAMEAATTAYVQPGDPAEHDANYQSDPANRPIQRTNGRSSRAGGGWFSLDLTVDPSADMRLVVTYFNELGLQPATGDFDLIVDGTTVSHFEPNLAVTGFFDAEYAVPSTLTRGKNKVTVRFQATGTSGRLAPIFGVRMIRANGR
jgi:hypothetical protein